MTTLSLSDELRLAVVSDIHLGHRRNKTEDIIKNLMAAFPDNAETARLDIIFLAGDVYDDLLSLPSDDATEIEIWFGIFLRVCKKHQIMVRILEGTPGHDWKQSKRFLAINDIAEIGADLKYVKDLSIEYIEQYGITVLYVPDEWELKTEKTLSQVHELLRAKGLDQVDYAIMHGQFEYQLPAHVKAPVHNSAEYLKIVRELIFIGHVHIHTRLDRIIAQGSFDRLSHGEEGPKGHVRAVVRANGERDIVFVENEGAKLFVTVQCLGMDLDQTIEQVHRKVGGLPPGSFTRLEGNEDNPVFSAMEQIVRLYPLFTWSKLVRENDAAVEDLYTEDNTDMFVPITLSRDNLNTILMERLTSTGISGLVFVASEEILKECMSDV